MTTKEQLIRKIEAISEADAEALLKNLETATQQSSHDPANPAHFTRIYGSWKDSRTTEEIINGLSESRERPSRSVSL